MFTQKHGKILRLPKCFVFYVVPKCIINDQSTDGECVVQANIHSNPMEITGV